MAPSPVRDRVPDPAASRFGDSVFRSQIFLAGAIGFVVCVTLALTDRRLDDSVAFFVGITTILWSTIAAATIPWLRIARGWQMVVPLVDIVALGMLRIAVPDSGFGILIVFPVIWLATSFRRVGAIAGSGLATILLLTQTSLAQLDVVTSVDPVPNPIAAISLSVTLIFVAGVIYATSRRVDSQRVLLRRQTRMLEAALAQARIQGSTLRESLDAVEFAVISLDRDGRTIDSNRATRALLEQLGLAPTTPWDRFPLYRDDKVTPVPAAEFPHVRALAGETVDSATYWVGHSTGTRFTVDVSARVLRDQQDAVDRVIVVLRDVSAEVRAITARDDLVTSMSHELRTPLSSVLGYVDLALESDGLPDETRDMLRIALSNTERLNTLVSDLLAARSSSPANTITLSTASCDVSRLAIDSVDAVRPMAADRLISIQLDVVDGVEAVVDAFRMRQVFDNLMSNAVKYNRSGGRITVGVHLVPGADETVEIRVADTGRGMTLDEQKGLFQRFYRAESVRGSTVHGTGLGLSISREIVLLHGGTIEVDSEPGRGTAVVVRVPTSHGSRTAPSTPAPTHSAPDHPETRRRP